MKTKHYLMFSIALLLLFEVSLNAKDSYYYYNGNKIPLQLRDDSVKDGNSVATQTKVLIQ